MKNFLLLLILVASLRADASSLSDATPPGAAARITPNTGTGLTVLDYGSSRRLVYEISVDKSAFVANAVTQDVTLATLPAKTIVYRFLANLTQAFVCGSICTTATLSMTCGKTAGGAEYLASFDADAATGIFGDGIAEVGSALNATNLLDLPSFSSTTTLQCRFTSALGNLGNGTTSNLSAGSITFYAITEVLP